MTKDKSEGISLLYVDDDVEARDMLCRVLCHRYPEIDLHVAANGETGLKSFTEHRQEIVVTDINMPVMDGIKMSEQIMLMNPDAEIIALTAYSDSHYLLRAIEIGISHYILKPIDFDKFFGIMDDSLAKIRLERKVAEQNAMIRQLNVELERKADDLSAVNQELEAFSYTVAHDLRTPMVSIGGYCQLLAVKYKASLDGTAQGYLDLIQSEINRMNALISSLLKFSMSARKDLDKQWADLSSMAGEISTNLRLGAPDRKVDFRIAEGVNGFGDPVLLRAVLENLMENAWKFTAGQEDALIEFGVIGGEEDLVYFIRDNGPGFGNDKAKELFESFSRLSGSDSVAGFGIGLSTVYRIIKRHGGRIWSEGKEGEGATFYFSL